MFFSCLGETSILNNPPMKMLDFSGLEGFENRIFSMFFWRGFLVGFFMRFFCGFVPRFVFSSILGDFRLRNRGSKGGF